MSAAWALRALIASTLLCASAFAIEQVFAWFGRARRWVWFSALVLSVAIPIVALMSPLALPSFGFELQEQTATVVWRSHQLVAVAPTSTVGPPAVSTGETGEHPARPRAPHIAWLSASLTLLLLAMSTAARLAIVRRRGIPAEINGRPVRLTERVGPLVTGIVRPVILVPSWVASASDEEQTLILDHEEEHIRGGDHWLLPLGSLLTIAMPWNPGVWIAYARFRLAIEMDCDARVIRRGADVRAYALALMRVAGSGGAHASLSPAWRVHASQLRYRIRALTDQLPRSRALRSATLSVGAAIFIAAATDAATHDAARNVPISSAPPRLALVGAPQGERTRLHGRKADATSTVGRNIPHPVSVFSAPDVANGIVSNAQQPEVGVVRVTGLSRRVVKVRVHFDGVAGRIAVLRGQLLKAESDSLGIFAVEINTPTDLAIRGDGRYRVVATSLESGTDVEIAVRNPADGPMKQYVSTARGPAAGVVAIGIDNGDTLTGWLRNALAARADSIEARHAFVTSNPPAEPEPGKIRVTTQNGTAAQVRVIFKGEIAMVAGRTVADSGEVLATTPFVVDFQRDGNFAVALVGVNSADTIRVDAMSAVKAWSVHSRSSTGTVVCGRNGFGGLGRYLPGVPVASRCDFMR